MEQCPFCQIIAGKAPAQIVCETAHTLSVLDIDPIQEGHILILPKIHAASISQIPETVLTEMMLTARKICIALEEIYHPDGYTVMQNGGEFCDFGHAHLHIFPRYRGDGFGWIDPPGTFLHTEEIARTIRDHLNIEV